MKLEATTPALREGESHLALDPAMLDKMAEWVAAGIVGGVAYALVSEPIVAFVRHLVRSQGRAKGQDLEERVYRELKRVKRKPHVSDADLRARAKRIFEEAGL
ncbi:MAG: hypothetical protein ACT4PE_11990 [Candidatus Eiseniibacteriota bacterium]